MFPLAVIWYVLIQIMCVSTFPFTKNSFELPNLYEWIILKQNKSKHKTMFPVMFRPPIYFSVLETRSSSGTTDSEQRRVRTKLRRFLQRRPTLQSVKEKGYIRGNLSSNTSNPQQNLLKFNQNRTPCFLWSLHVQITSLAVTWIHSVTEKTPPFPNLWRSVSEQWRGEVNAR